MAPSLANVFLRGVIHADAGPPQESDGRPHARPKQRAKQPRAPVWLECAPKDSCRLVRFELNALYIDAMSVIGKGGLTGRTQVSNPDVRAVGRLEEPAAVELGNDQGD